MCAYPRDPEGALATPTPDPALATPPLDPEDVIEIASVLDLGDHAFLVGGQATNLWAERYANRATELAMFGPYTSVDVDYHGHREAAEKLAHAFNGRVRFPKFGDETPNSAIVEIEIHGREIRIDFIHTVLGVRRRDLKVSELRVPAKSPAATFLMIPVMHPVACLESRVANVLSPAMGRSDAVAIRQLRASPMIVREFISEALRDGDFREAQACLRAVYVYMRSDQFGRRVLELEMDDPLNILRYFAEDERLDARYRRYNLNGMIADIEARRVKLRR